MNSNPRPTNIADLGGEITLIEENLRSQLEGHRKLLICIERNREAVRQANMQQIHSICEQKNEIAQHLSELEKQRLMVLGRLTERLEPDAERPIPLDRVAAALEEPARGRFEALAAELRAAIKDVRTASAVVRGATDALARHMTGLMQTVQSVLGRAKVYGRLGRLVTGEQNQFCVDIRS